VDNTFITPVFNGSASLRDAAGTLIENTTKSVRRKETVDDAYMEKLFSDVTSLYRLNGGRQADSVGKKELGRLPGTAKALIIVLAAAWALMGLSRLLVVLKKRRNK
jgi:multiple sugar transport system substrate-binding protein